MGEIQDEDRMGKLRRRWRESQLFEDMGVVLRSEEGGGMRRSVNTRSVMDGETPSTIDESEEEGGEWPIL